MASAVKNKTKTGDEFVDDVPARDLLADIHENGESAQVMSQDITVGDTDGEEKSPGDGKSGLVGMSRDIPRGKIKTSPYNPRKHFDEEAIKALADSVRKFGLLQPIIVRKIDVPIPGPHGTTYEHYYEIVGGERRYRACTRAGLSPVPCRVIAMTDGEAREVAIIENLQREDLSPLEEAAALSAMVESGMTQTQLAARIGKSQDRISRRIGLLRLPALVQALIEEKRLSASHGERLQSWAGQPTVCEAIALRCVSEGWAASRLDGSGGPEVAAIVAEVTGVPPQSSSDETSESEAEEAENVVEPEPDEESLQTSIYDIPQVTDPLPIAVTTAVTVADPVETEPETPVGQELTKELASTITTEAQDAFAHQKTLSREEESDNEETPTPKYSRAVDFAPKTEGAAPPQPLPDPPAHTPEIVRTPPPVANAEPTLEAGPGAPTHRPSAPAPATQTSAPANPVAPVATAATTVTQPAGGSRVATDISVDADDWLWENNTTLDAVLASAMEATLSPFALNCLRAIADKWNNDHSEREPVTLTAHLESLLAGRASTDGFDLNTLRSNPHA